MRMLVYIWMSIMSFQTTYVMGVKYVDPTLNPHEADHLDDFVEATAHFFTRVGLLQIHFSPPDCLFCPPVIVC